MFLLYFDWLWQVFIETPRGIAASQVVVTCSRCCLLHQYVTLDGSRHQKCLRVTVRPACPGCAANEPGSLATWSARMTFTRLGPPSACRIHKPGSLARQRGRPDSWQDPSTVIKLCIHQWHRPSFFQYCPTRISFPSLLRSAVS